MSENLEILKKLTPELKDLVEPHSSIINYDIPEGKVTGVGLYNIHEAAIQVAACSKGSVFPEHTHIATEWLIVISGKCKVVFPDRTKILKPADGAYILPDTCHSVEFLENTSIIGITIPADTYGYPSAKVDE